MVTACLAIYATTLVGLLLIFIHNNSSHEGVSNTEFIGIFVVTFLPVVNTLILIAIILVNIKDDDDEYTRED